MLEFPNDRITEEFGPAFDKLFAVWKDFHDIQIVAEDMHIDIIKKVNAKAIRQRGRYIQIGQYAADNKEKISHWIACNTMYNPAAMISLKGLEVHKKEWLNAIEFNLNNVLRVSYHLSDATQIKEIADKYKMCSDLDLNIVIADDVKQIAERPGARLSSFAKQFFQLNGADGICAELRYPGSFRIELLDDRSDSYMIRTTINSSIAIEVLNSVPKTIKTRFGVKHLAHNIIIDIESNHLDRTEIPKIDLPKMNIEAPIDIIELMDVNSIEKYLGVLTNNAKVISAVVDHELNISEASLATLYRSRAELFLLRGIDRRPFRSVYGLGEVADASHCYEVIGREQPSGEKAICFFMEKVKCPMYDIV